MGTEEGPCEDTARRRPLASRGERPQEKTPEATRTTRNTWLQWPQQTNTAGKETNLTEDHCPVDGRGVGACRGHGRGTGDAWAQRAARPACAGLRVWQQRGGGDGTARRVLRDEAGEVGWGRSGDQPPAIYQAKQSGLICYRQ